MKPTLFLTRQLPPLAMEKLASYFDVESNPDDRVLTKEEVIQGVKGKDALLCLLTDAIDDEIMQANPNLKVISNYAVGFNNIDVKAATKHQIPVCITPGVLTETTADLAWALITAVSRRVVEADRYLREGTWGGWGPMQFLGDDVHGKTIGIVGMGRIGSAIARRAVGFGMKVVYTARSSKPEMEASTGAQQVDLESLLKTSDYVSVSVPFMPETRHLIGANQLKLMKKTAYLINTARGPIVDEDALVLALKSGQIAGAGLDVFEEEPKVHPGLIDLPNTVLLPHIASATIETRTKMGLLAAENAIAIMEGSAPHAIVNPEVISAPHS